MAKRTRTKRIETITHDEASRRKHPHGGVPVGDGEGRSEPHPGGV